MGLAGGRGVWALAWSTIALSSLQSLMGVVDLVFVSSLGSEAVAAVAGATQVHFLFHSLLAAVSAGTVAIVAREWGRENRDEVARAARCSVALSAVIGVVMLLAVPFSEPFVAMRGAGGAVCVMSGLGLLIVAFARPLADLFGAAGTETTALTVTFIYILGAAQPLMAIEFSLAGALRGAGDTRFPFYVTLLVLFCVRLGTALLIAKPLFGSVVAVWLCLIADYACKATLLTWRFARGRWKQIDI